MSRKKIEKILLTVLN
ncbi:UNVERIFIED_CONTAM: hypothetical protein GTU68_007286 [Idotea baltica]|nr:hypothetical protein [Idotea baltica]